MTRRLRLWHFCLWLILAPLLLIMLGIIYFFRAGGTR